MADKKRLLIIGSVWPEPGSSAAGGRMMQLIRLFLDEGYDITFASTAANSEHAINPDQWDIEFVSIEMNSSSFDLFIDDLQPHIVMFDRFMVEEQFGWRVAEHCPDALRILDTEDMHCLRRSRSEALKSNRTWRVQDLLQSDTAKREIASILRSDCSLIISEYEMKLLQEVFNVNPDLLFYLPFLLRPIEAADIKAWPSFDERRDFMTIGNFRHPPNMDSVRYLKSEVWPLIRRELPDAELHIYGAYPTGEAKRLHQPDNGFFIDGRAESSQEVMSSARVCLAPLRFGAGLKGKLIEAMQCGTPSVTTSIGLEGIAGDYDWPGAVKQKLEALAAAAVKLYSDKEAWQQAQEKGKVIINKRFNAKQFEADFLSRITFLDQNLETHRNANFTGAMLMHHTAASTKFMSKWIEEKNKEQ